MSVLAASPAAADTTFATWNLGAAWDAAIEARAEQFRAAAEAVGADVYVVQEVMSMAGAQAIAGHLGFDDAHIAVSDFAATSEQGDDDDKANVFFHLEVAVISRIPILSAQELEFDRDDTTGPIVNKPSIATSHGRLFVPNMVWETLDSSTQRGLRWSRGVLRVELEGDIVIYAIHAKSDFNGFCYDIRTASELLDSISKDADEESGLPATDIAVLQSAIATLANVQAAEEESSFSRTWITNAQKREAMFAAVADKAPRDIAGGKTVLVMGDFNIAINDPRSGSDIDVDNDCNPTRACFSPVEDQACTGQDGLDESHFIIAGGLNDDLTMTALTANLTETLTGDFSSAIDHIYVDGPKADRFTRATTKSDGDGAGFGSDHLPVVTTLTD